VGLGMEETEMEGITGRLSVSQRRRMAMSMVRPSSTSSTEIPECIFILTQDQSITSTTAVDAP